MTKTLPLTIAIDGPSASGKSTVGELLARRLGYLYFDTGVMYRALTCVARNRHIALTDEQQISRLAEQLRIDVLPPTVNDGRQNTILADGQDISNDLRSSDIDANVSLVSSYPKVREAMAMTRDFVNTLYGAAELAVAGGASRKEAFAACRAAMDPRFGSFAIYEHCLPFNVSRAYDEASGIDDPMIWTAERDREMWAALQT